eukprot:TRINITY_DN5635_c0_g1_i3.p1 TRINITY_DN5635_c0_g1~~TRINITY_DN5635_c0_g1_i3.p1  ORF type:complete len:199 (-),score=21.84 TRINITY_DN5635_c0_g1_i3:1068-1664(-)
MAVESFDAAPAASVNSFAPCLPGWSAFESRKGFIERLRKAVCILSSGLEQHASADLSHLSHLRLLSVLLAALGAHSTIVAARPSKTHPIPHHFLQVAPPSEMGGTPVVVDILFRDMMSVPRPSSLYCQLLDAIPKVFVGDLDKCLRIVRDLSLEMSDSLQVGVDHLTLFHGCLDSTYVTLRIASNHSSFCFPFRAGEL